MENRNNRLFAISAISFTFMLSVAIIFIIYSNRERAYLDDILIGIIFILTTVFVLFHFLKDSLDRPGKGKLNSTESLNHHLNEIKLLRKEIHKLKYDLDYRETGDKKEDYDFKGNIVYDLNLIKRSMRLRVIRGCRDEIKRSILLGEVSGESYREILEESYSEYCTSFENEKKRDPVAFRYMTHYL